MKLLLTSAGISNPSINNNLVDLLGKRVAESNALFIPTSAHALDSADIARRVIRGSLGDPFCELGWKSLGLLELTALPTLKEELWTSWLQQTDALLVGGGDPLYLVYWMRQSGLANLLPSLRPEMVYVGLSAGSMIAGPTFGGKTFGNTKLPSTDQSGLGMVDFAMLMHLEHPIFPDNTFPNAEKKAASLGVPTYAMDDSTAIKVIDGKVEVISEGKWKLFTP